MMRRAIVSFEGLVLAWALLLATTITGGAADPADFQFTDELLRWTVTAVRLSLLAYTDEKSVLADYALSMYRDNPDQAAVTQIDGVCFAAFRGTVFFNWKDLTQNFKLGNVEVCTNGACCDVEKGFYDGYHTNYRELLEENVRQCTSGCDGGQCPLVLTGHSQGGAIASVAALYFADLDPTVITFGQMAAIDQPCSLINSDKYYRFENSRAGYFGPTYDPIPNLPYFASHFGHQIMLGDDATGIAYIGKDTHVHFRPYDTDRAFRTHRLVPKTVGYLNRVENLAAHYEPRIEPTAMNDTLYDCFLKNSSTTASDFVFHDENDEDTPSENGSEEMIDETNADEEPFKDSSGGKLDVPDEVSASVALRGTKNALVATGSALVEESNEKSSGSEVAEGEPTKTTNETANQDTVESHDDSPAANLADDVTVVEGEPTKTTNETGNQDTAESGEDGPAAGLVDNLTVAEGEPTKMTNETGNQGTAESNDDSHAANLADNVTVAEGEQSMIPVSNETLPAGDFLIAGDKEDPIPELSAENAAASSTNSTEDTFEQAPELNTVPANTAGNTSESHTPPDETKPEQLQAVSKPKYVVRSNGFVNDSRCSRDVECLSRNCDRKRCQPADGE